MVRVLIKTGISLVIALGVLIAVLIIRSLPYASSSSIQAKNPDNQININSDRLAQNLAMAVQFKTISHQQADKFDGEAFLSFQKWLRKTYPNFYKVVTTETVAGYSQLNTWAGSNPSLAPMVFLAHQDVVPADESAKSGWQHPPFAGVIADGFVWGRGSIDNKGSLIGLLEAADLLAAKGFAPQRTLIFAFGHDEEIGGGGADAMSDILKLRGISPWAVIDEGGAITTNMPDIAGPVARIGVAEKGYLTITLTARAVGGHSSTPPKITALGEISRAIAALEANPFEQKLDPVLIKMLHATARSEEVGFVNRVILSNLWLFGPLVENKMKKSKSGAALLGTTIAPTMLNAGIKENALPREAVAFVNFRISARNSVSSVIDHVIKSIDNPAIEVAIIRPPGIEPSPVSQIDSGPYLWLKDAIDAGFPGTLIAPNVVLMATDSRHYAKVTDDIYRFAPYIFDSSDLTRLHGLNERIGIENLAHGVQVYHLMLERAGSLPET